MYIIVGVSGLSERRDCTSLNRILSFITTFSLICSLFLGIFHVLVNFMLVYRVSKSHTKDHQSKTLIRILFPVSIVLLLLQFASAIFLNAGTASFFTTRPTQYSSIGANLELGQILQLISGCGFFIASLGIYGVVSSALSHESKLDIEQEAETRAASIMNIAISLQIAIVHFFLPIVSVIASIAIGSTAHTFGTGIFILYPAIPIVHAGGSVIMSILYFSNRSLAGYPAFASSSPEPKTPAYSSASEETKHLTQ